MSGNKVLNKTIDNAIYTLNNLFQETQEIVIKFLTDKALWCETTEYCYFIYLNKYENIVFQISPSTEKHILIDIQQKTIQCKNMESVKFQYSKISKSSVIQQIHTPICSQFVKEDVVNKQFSINCLYTDNSLKFQDTNNNIIQIENFNHLLNTEYFSIIKSGQSLPQLFEISNNNFQLSRKYSEECSYFQALTNQSIENVFDINSTTQQSKQYKFTTADIQKFINPIFTQTFHPETQLPMFYKYELSKEIENGFVDNYDIEFLKQNGLILRYFNGEPVEKSLFFYDIATEKGDIKTRITYKVYTNIVSQYISCTQNFITSNSSAQLKLEPIQFQQISSTDNSKFDIPEQLRQIQYIKEFDFINSVDIIGLKSIAEANQLIIQRHKRNDLILDISGIKKLFSFKTKAVKQTNNPITNVYKQNVVGQIECTINNKTVDIQKHNGMFTFQSTEDVIEITCSINLESYNQGLVGQTIDINNQPIQFDGFDLKLLLKNNKKSCAEFNSNEIIPVLKKECKTENILYNAEQFCSYPSLEIAGQKKVEINIQKPIDGTYTLDTSTWNIVNNQNYTYGFDFITSSESNKCIFIKHCNDLTSGEVIKIDNNYLYAYTDNTEDVLNRLPLIKLFKLKTHKWYSLYITNDGCFIKIYLNGQKIFSMEQNKLPRKNQNIILNEHLIPDQSGTNGFTGNIRNFQLFNRAMQQQEILQIYKKTFDLLTADVLYKFETSCISETTNKVEVIHEVPSYKTIETQYDNQFYDTDTNVYHQLTNQNGQIIIPSQEPYSETFYINKQLSLTALETDNIYTVKVTYPTSNDYMYYLNERF